MKRILICLLLSQACYFRVYGQLPNGSVAPDFTVTDLNGNTHNLYTYLNQGKTVYLDIFATWCNPCWNYHQSHALQNLWTQYGPSGTNEVVVIAIEGSPSTNVACLYGPSGCVGGTVGNWLNGVTYPIVHTDMLNGSNNYNQGIYPTIYMICPSDKKIWQAGQLTTTGLWNLRTNKCITGSQPIAPVLVSKSDVKCFNTNTGKVDISVSGGLSPFTYLWSNGNTLQDLIDVPAGTYTCTITGSNGATALAGPYTVSNPPSPLTATGDVVQSSGCNGVTGSVTANPTGGWSAGYTYKWNNNATTKTLTGIPAGLYNCTVTDNNLCTKTLSVNLTQAPAPNVTISNSAGTGTPTITCANPTVQLQANATSNSGSFNYTWSVISGNIVSGMNSQVATVNQTGAYQVVVTDLVSSCTKATIAQVNENTNPPTCAAPTTMEISCAQSSVSLTATAVGGTQYQWVASNGGVIVSGANALTCVAGAPGTYTFTVTNTANGCTATATTLVTANSSIPNLTASASGAITCLQGSASLTASSTTSGVTFLWTGPNNFSSSQANATTTVPGAYTVVATAGNGCTNVQQVNIVANNTSPTVSIQPGATQLSCANPTTQLVAGATPSANYVYGWTLNGSPLATGATLTASQAGVYMVAATDPATGCTATASVSITSSPGVQATVTQSASIGCFGGNNAALSATGFGGTLPLTYTWSNGAQIQSISSLVAGTYTVTVTDAVNCTAIASFTVTQPTAVSATAAISSAISCNGGTGTLLASASGGSGSTYTYTWSNGQNTASASVTAGTYNVMVTDINGCASTTTIAITQPTALVISAGATPQTMQGVNNGTVTCNASGGTGAYNYAWSNGQSGSSLTDLAPGTYTVTVSDANGCTMQATAVVQGVNCAISASATVTHARCFGANNGSVQLNVSGGTAPFTYAYSGASGATGLAAGSYTSTITDALGCNTVVNFTVNQPTAISIAVPAVTNGQCEGASEGAVSLSDITGGTGAYTISWSNGSSGTSISNLAAGTYTATVTDVNGCTALSAPATVMNNDQVAPTLTCPSNMTSCPGVAVNFQAPQVVDNCQVDLTKLQQVAGPASGTVFVEGVTKVSYRYVDSGNNAGTCSFTVTVSTPVRLVSSQVTNGVISVAPGSVTVQIDGGNAPYTYTWTNGAGTVVGNNQNLTNVTTAGAYTLRVTDANGCSMSFPPFIVDMTVSAQEPIWLQSLTLIPNPASQIAFITWTDPADMHVQVLDMSGRVLLSRAVKQSTQVELPLDSWPEGTFLVRLQTGNETGYRKLIKQ